MSVRLRLELLGPFHASFENGEPCVLPTRKAEGLLAYLARPAGRFHSRDTLAALLWGDSPEAQARQSLRQALGSLRRALGPAREAALLSRGTAVALDADAVVVDATELEAAVKDGCMEALERIAALYRGEFLAGVRLDEPPFEQWRVVEAEALFERALEGLVRLLGQQQRLGDRDEQAIQTAMRVLAMDPLQEPVHRALIRLLLARGRRAAALQQYQTCVTALRQELGTEPDEETRDLYRRILTSYRSTVDPSPSVASRLRAPAGPRATETPIIGRASELGRLQRAVAQMLDDGGRVVLIKGEAGIGKSRLIQEYLTVGTKDGLRFSFGRCHETERTLPFRSWIDALRPDDAALARAVAERLGAATAAQLAPLLPELSPTPASAAPAGAAPVVLFDPLLALVTALAAEGPLIIVIEDLHWADSMSAQFLAFLGRRIHRLPVLVLGSMRPEEMVDAPVLARAVSELREDGRFEEIELSPLTEDESRELLRALRPSSRARAHEASLADDIVAISEGNPFVIVESTRVMQDRHASLSPQTLRVGSGVQELVAARLDRLADLPRQCAAVAAAIGTEFSFPLLARAARVSDHDAADAVEALVRRRILDNVGDRLDFCHDWIRLVAYEGQLPPKRALLHAAIGEALEDLHRERPDDVADQLGTHYAKAGRFDKAVPYLLRFGDLAAQRYALDDAYRALGQAMAGVAHLPAADRDRARLEVAMRQAYVLSVRGRQREILELLGDLADTVNRVADAALVSEYYFRLGLTYFFIGDRVNAQLAGEHALEYGERLGDPERIGKALHVLSLQAYEVGRPADGVAHARRAIPLLDRPHTQQWLGLVYLDLALNLVAAGELDAALAATERVEAVARTASVPRISAFAGYVVASVQVLRGDVDLAIETARRALEGARDATVIGLISGALGLAYLERGDAGSAVALLTKVIDQLKDSPVRNVEIRTTALLGEALVLAGDPRARETADHALELARADGMPFNVGVAQRALGRIAHAEGDDTRAAQLLADAVTTFSECGATFEVARTRVNLAAARAALDDARAAREHLAAAIADFEAANAPKRSAAARALARSLD